MNFCGKDHLKTFCGKDHLRTFCGKDHLRTFCGKDHLRTFCDRLCETFLWPGSVFTCSGIKAYCSTIDCLGDFHDWAWIRVNIDQPFAYRYMLPWTHSILKKLNSFLVSHDLTCFAADVFCKNFKFW